MQRVNSALRPVMVHGPRRGHQRLTGHLPSEDPLPVIVRRAASEDIDLNGLQIKQRHHIFKRRLPRC